MKWLRIVEVIRKYCPTDTEKIIDLSRTIYGVQSIWLIFNNEEDNKYYFPPEAKFFKYDFLSV